MKLKFSQEQIDMLHKIGVGFDVEKDLTDDEYFEIDEKVSDYLMQHGFEKDYEPNRTGLICESIMDLLGKQ